MFENDVILEWLGAGARYTSHSRYIHIEVA